MQKLLLLLVLVIPNVAVLGCQSLSKIAAPSNFRNWSPDQAVLPITEFREDEVIVHNVRNCRYFGDETYVVNYEDRAYQLADLTGVDFLMAPFANTPWVAHTMLSFEFTPSDGPPQHLAVSIEIRKEQGEKYAAWKGSARQYELMYVVADERDVIELRTNHRGEDVYLYRTIASPEQSRLLFVDVMQRVNKLAHEPEFYDTVLNNCTTNLVEHINRIEPRRLKYSYKVLLPGYSDQLAYDKGLIEQQGTFEETKAKAYLNGRALAAADSADFSRAIRR